MGRGGRPKTRDGAERRCIVTREVEPVAGLIRFVVGPDGSVVADVMGKLPGRGMWVKADRAALETAASGGVFSKAAKAKVAVPDGLITSVEDGLVRRLIDLISLARKSGRAVAGYEKVKSWLMQEQVAVLLQASDGSERGKTKLRSPRGADAFFEVLTRSELGLSFGREHVIHAALAAGGLTDAVRDDALRLLGVRGNDGGKAAGKVKKTT